MEIQLKASTNDIRTKEEALRFARAAARVCYSKYDFDIILEEEDKIKLTDRLLDSGHHSPFDHINLTFYMKDIPKFGAMILNNERPYTTSEKSARYTKMELAPEEEELYQKWIGIFTEAIRKEYNFLDDVKVKKLAQENARNLTSVFTPTRMLHTISFRQLNYIIHFFRDFIAEAVDDDFNVRVKDFMKDFIAQTEVLLEPRLEPKMKKRGLAQAHSHRTLDYSIARIEDDFFVPAILDARQKKEWLDDIRSLKDNFPQGQLITVNEQGTLSDFISRITERLCGHAQWEIMHTSRQLLDRYAEETDDPDIKALLQAYTKGPKCTFPGITCPDPCPFGPALGLKRLI